MEYRSHVDHLRTGAPRLAALLFVVLLAACRPSDGPPASGTTTAGQVGPCGAEEPADDPSLTTLVLVDQTTALERADTLQFVRELGGDIRKNGGRVQLLAFGGASPALLRKVFDQTFPASSVSAEGKEVWVRTPAERRASAQCLAARRAELDAALTRTMEAVDTRAAGYSPVLEAIRAALGSRQERHGVVRLIVVSDSIEHAGMSFYEPRTDRLRLPTPDRVVAELRRLDAMPDARQVFVWHVGFGASGPAADPARRTLRATAETAALRRVFDAVWKEAGAAAWVYGEPMPTNGFPLPQVRE